MSPDFLGTLPGWITAASTTTGVVTIIVTFLRRGVSLKGLRNADEADIRDHYAQEVEALRGQLLSMERHYREMLEKSDRRHEECEAARSAMRQEIDGLKRQIPGLSADRLLILEQNGPPSEIAPHSFAAAKRIKGENGK
jgi:hypothetical protein